MKPSALRAALADRHVPIFAIGAAALLFLAIDYYDARAGIIGNILKAEITVTRSCLDAMSDDRLRYEVMDKDEREFFLWTLTDPEKREFLHPPPGPFACGITLPYRWIAGLLVVVVGAHLLARLKKSQRQ